MHEDERHRWTLKVTAQNNMITTLRARLAEAERERDAYKQRLERQGVCMSCVIVPMDTFGCSDCLNTGYEHGEPLELIAEREKTRRLVECVRKIRVWNKDMRGFSISPGLDNLLATVSDLTTAAEDEVKS